MSASLSKVWPKEIMVNKLCYPQWTSGYLIGKIFDGVRALPTSIKFWVHFVSI